MPDYIITTPSGKQLTLINPAYMTRQVHEMAEAEYGVRGHITSLKPIRPENAPDPWETKALQAFERGQKEVSSVEQVDGQEYMRLMRPFVTEKGCLKCHAAQGYREGDIRGGVSASVPMGPLKAIAGRTMLTLGTGHLFLWLMGMGGIVLGTQRLRRKESDRALAAQALQEAKDDLQIRVEERTSELRIANKQLREQITERKAAEEYLELAVSRWESTFDAVEDMVAVIGADYRILLANRAMKERFKGVTVPGAFCYELIHGTDSPPETCRAGKVFESGQPERWEIQEEHLGGCWFDISTSPIKDESGKVRQIVHSVQDITERKVAEEEREKLLHDMGERVKELRCMYGVAESIQTRTALEEIFQDVAQLIPPGWHYPQITRGKVIFDGKEYVSEPFDQTRWKQSSDIIVNGQPQGSIEVYYLEQCPELDEGPFMAEERDLINGMAKSISEAIEGKRAEEELEKHREHLEELVGERTSELEQRISQIQQLNRAMVNLSEDLRVTNANVESTAHELAATNAELESFAYSVSHDLRAPLRAMDGFSLALLEDCSDKLDEQGREHLNRVREAAQRMDQLIDDLLALSRVTRAEMQRETVDLSALAGSIADELKRLDPQRQVELAIAPDLRAKGDRRLVEVVLRNLLGNAWKFTSAKPAARIEFAVEQVNGYRAFFVRDNGAGFDMAYANKLFGPFQRLHSMEEFPGTGIGLATVQRVIHRHGGKVWAEGQVDKGATFYFTLPETPQS
jgi:PAS domain S-box-containing protein